MSSSSAVIIGRIVEAEESLSLAQLCALYGAREQQILELVAEGVFDATDDAEPHFTGIALRRARVAIRLQRDLGINTAGVALAIELLERIEMLERRPA